MTHILESSCSQSHWFQHKTTDEDKTLLTTPSSTSTLRTHSGPLYVTSQMELSFSFLVFLLISSFYDFLSASLTFPIFWVQLFKKYFKVFRTCVTPPMWCRFGNKRSQLPNWNVLHAASRPTSGCYGHYCKMELNGQKRQPTNQWVFHLDKTRNRSWSGELFPIKGKG